MRIFATRFIADALIVLAAETTITQCEHSSRTCIASVDNN
jgi:hypothetical protein